ncbi:MAG: aspartate carbamoyltransferase regulatory subunit [Candidatus Bathyarchaeota archaeon]|nr:MAG: aspartate carbamoyltransferase regulatory subunit [Candidatus Bathyarchaeota archaeon]
MAETTLLVSKIKDGTVIDHITGGHALDVVKILGITGRTKGAVLIAMHVPSKRLQTKDIVKVEGRELKPKEVDKIALLAPQASINIIRDYQVAEKQHVKLPKVIRGTVTCGNPACISNSNEPVQPKFYVQSQEPLMMKCHYCSFLMEKQDILKQF